MAIRPTLISKYKKDSLSKERNDLWAFLFLKWNVVVNSLLNNNNLTTTVQSEVFSLMFYEKTLDSLVSLGIVVSPPAVFVAEEDQKCDAMFYDCSSSTFVSFMQRSSVEANVPEFPIYCIDFDKLDLNLIGILCKKWAERTEKK